MTPGDIYCKRGAECFCGTPSIKCVSGAMAMEPESVRHPQHYSRFKIEPLTFAMANGLNGLEMNVVKYTCRAPFKNGVEDYRKAIRCLEMLIETADREARIAAGEKASDVWSVTL